jgi:hypothetical protein
MRRFVLVSALVVFAHASASADDPPGDVAVPTEPAPAPAEVPAAKPTPAVVPVVAEPKAQPDVDLSALDLDPAHPDEHLNIYGFADVTWRALLMPRSSIGANFFPKENSFLIGNINLYLTKRLSPKWRSFLELRFLYAPSGAKNADGTFVKATAPDPADLERPVDWGGVSIERAYLEYEVNESLTVQAGAFLTPYGIWNVDHGSPAIIPVTRPYIIGEGLFPDQQTGLHVYGKHPIGKYQVGYHATLTNGRGTFQAFRDLDDNKALGGRLELETPWLDGVRFGISAYRGRFTDRPPDQIAVDANGVPFNTTPLGTSYDESAWGADVVLRRGALVAQAEVIGNDRDFRAGSRARALNSPGYEANGRYMGAYALVGYRFDRLWQVMPFGVIELDRLRPSVNLGDHPTVLQMTGGLNFRPDPSVVLKLNFVQANLRAPLLDLTLRIFMMQAAWAF